MEKSILIGDILKNELEARQSRNTEYSLRSLAIHLDISPSFLSNIMNKKISPTPSSINRICLKLGYDNAQIDRLNRIEIFKKFHTELKENTSINLSQSEFLSKCSEHLMNNKHLQ